VKKQARSLSECLRIGTRKIESLVEELGEYPNIGKFLLAVHFIESILRTYPNPEEVWSRIKGMVKPKGTLPLLLRRREKMG